MDRIIEWNQRGLWRSGPAGRGFLARNGGSGATRRLAGTTKYLRGAFRKGTANEARVVQFDQQAGWRVIASNPRLGVHIHNTLARMYRCVTPPARAATALTSARAETLARACVHAARTFVREKQLAPYASEVVLAHPRLAVGTRADALFRSRISGRLVLVSWKTGVGATTEAEMCRNRAQVAFEWLTAEEAAPGVHISAAVVVYLGAAQRSTSVRGFYAMDSVPRELAASLYAKFCAHIERRQLTTTTKRNRRAASGAA